MKAAPESEFKRRDDMHCKVKEQIGFGTTRVKFTATTGSALFPRKPHGVGIRVDESGACARGFQLEWI
jgi:hypothetical protein